jgi:hypothetical protein
MKICIIGYGGFGKEVAEYIRQDCNINNHSWDLDNIIICVFDDFVTTCPDDFVFMGKIDDYIPVSDDYFLVALGDPVKRFEVVEKLKAKGAQFTTFIHESVYIASTAKIGIGTIVCPNCVINAEASVGDFCAVNVGCSIGHETFVGDFSVLSSFSVINGKSKIGRGCFLGTRATMFPKAVLGDFCTVDSHCCVKGIVEKSNIISSRMQYYVIKNRLSKEF